MLPDVPTEIGDAWLQTIFHEHPELGMVALTQLGDAPRTRPNMPGMPQMSATAQSSDGLQIRKRIVGQLLAVAGENPELWSTALNMVTAGWIEQAEQALGMNADQQQPEIIQRMQNGWQGYQQFEAQPQNGRRPTADSAANLLAAAPDNAWRAAIDPDVSRHIGQLCGQLAARAVDEPRVLAAIDAALPLDPEFAKSLAETYLTAWTETLGQQGQNQPQMYQYMVNGRMRRYYNNNNGGEGISLTRAHQIRNLARFAEILATLKAHAVPPLDANLLVNTFNTCHSPAEVFRGADVQQVFGPAAERSKDVTVQLVESMRGRLRGMWRDPNMQNQAGTKRTDKQIAAEAARGYALAEELLSEMPKEPADEWAVESLKAGLLFDQSEFAYSLDAPLAVYTQMRDRAFATFHHAADLYAAGQGKLLPERQSASIFVDWFQAALGTSEAANLMPQQRNDEDQLTAIHDALRRLPPVAIDRHLAMFAMATSSQANMVPSQVKPRFQAAVAQVLKDHPAGDAVRKQLALYDDLLAEVALHAAIDGSADVGHREPFGLQLAIRSTTTMAREGERFAQILQVMQPNIYPGGMPENDARKKFEAEIRDKLGKDFEIKDLRFHDPTVTPRGFGREGWVETPLVYLLLQAKGPAVDRLPQVQLDMSFNDGGGEVLLPIASQVVLLNAGAASADARPLQDLKIKFTLDDRAGPSAGPARNHGGGQGPGAEA